ncbi:MAG TPA: aminoacetone oxidase family FAD-binding enzyme, partial [Rhodobacterales bacterium]|nr:aminoacetone oxidase family FAD-binding enzyme [Rhodobacterales bacterium]
ALARFGPWDFLDLLARHGIDWHEKSLGQLFCDGKSTQIVEMLLAEARAGGVTLRLGTEITAVSHAGGRFHVTTDSDDLSCDNLVLATGGKSIPKMGASGLAYDIARQFGHRIVPPRPGLVPLTFGNRFAALSGLSLPARVSNARARFDESILFTHRGLSGPAILQISSYWREGEAVEIDLLPDLPLAARLGAQRQVSGRKALTTELGAYLPARLVDHLAAPLALTGTLGDQSDARLAEIEAALHHWQLTPSGSEGWRTAEVTLGGIATDALSSKTMESTLRPGLYVIGEAVDVTGWLGGYNFQWAWASAHAAARAIAQR